MWRRGIISKRHQRQHRKSTTAAYARAIEKENSVKHQQRKRKHGDARIGIINKPWRQQRGAV